MPRSKLSIRGSSGIIYGHYEWATRLYGPLFGAIGVFEVRGLSFRPRSPFIEGAGGLFVQGFVYIKYK